MEELKKYIENRLAELNSYEPTDEYDEGNLDGKIDAFEDVIGWIEREER